MYFDLFQFQGHHFTRSSSILACPSIHLSETTDCQQKLTANHRFPQNKTPNYFPDIKAGESSTFSLSRKQFCSKKASHNSLLFTCFSGYHSNSRPFLPMRLVMERRSDHIIQKLARLTQAVAPGGHS